MKNIKNLLIICGLIFLTSCSVSTHNTEKVSHIKSTDSSMRVESIFLQGSSSIGGGRFWKIVFENHHYLYISGSVSSGKIVIHLESCPCKNNKSNL